MTWAACTAWVQSSTKKTSRYSTSPGKLRYSHSTSRWGPGASGASTRLVTRFELIPAPEYLRRSYYERWLHSLIEKMVKGGLVTRAEVESGKSAPGSPRATPALIAGAVPGKLAKGNPANRDVQVLARFKAGQRVRARNIHPAGHTRLPRYARGKLGTIYLDHGVHVFPDTNAHSLGENPQHLYSVRFAAQELWGEQASSRDAVYLDMWENYIECA